MGWVLGILTALMVLTALSKPIVAWVDHDLKYGEPRANFFTPEAYRNCAAMSAEAKRRGATHWTCHAPESIGPG